MNFFGHSVMARWHSDSPNVLFGAMLPDFAGMAQAAMPRIQCPEVRAGVAHHHATDDVFHRTATFRSLCNTASRHLESFGLHRGGALAVGHVGVELLIDCALGSDPEACGDYLTAVQAGEPFRLRRAVEWATLEERESYEHLHDVVSGRGLAVTNSDPERIAFRLQRVLAQRPRLALRDGDCRLVEDWARAARVTVTDAVPSLLQELRAGLDRALEGPGCFGAHSVAVG